MSKKQTKKQIDALLSSSDSDSSESVQITKKSKKDKNAKRKVSVASESSVSQSMLKNKRKQSAEKKKAPKKVAKVESSDESSESVVVAKKVTKKSKKAVESSDESSSESEAPVKQVKKEKKVAKKQESSDEASNSDSESEVVTKKSKAPVEEVVEEEGCKEIFVKNLPYSAHDDGMYEHFGKFGTVVNVKICKDRETGKSRGFGFVEFELRSSAKKAISELGEIDGRGYLAAFSDNKDSLNGQRGPGGPQGGQGGERSFTPRGDVHTVFVGNLKFRIREDSIRSFFSGCGNIVSVRVAKDMEGKEKGFGHVDFDTKEACDAAVALAGGEIEGRECRVDHAEKRRNDGGGSRGGFGGGRGGDRGGRGGFGGGRGGGRGGFSGGFDKPRHGPMGGAQNKKTFNDDSD
jgi:nucleolin